MHSLDLDVQRLIWRGRGLARLESGQIVLIEPGVFPGERVRVTVTKATSDYLAAQWTHILHPHPRRRPHPCSLARNCGGCRFGGLAHADQLSLKHELVSRELRRALPAEFRENLPVMELVAGPKQWRYRWRGQMHVRGGRPHMMSHQGQEPLECSDCLLLAKPLAAQMEELCASVPDGRVTVAASPSTGRAGLAGQDLHLALPLPEFGLEIHLPPAVFFQANWGGNQDLVRYVCGQIDPEGTVADLYAGAGNFALALGMRGQKVLALEADPGAVHCGRQNAARLGLGHVRFKRMNLARTSPREDLLRAGARTAIIDPPRTGGGKKLAAALDVTGLERLIWVSCDVVNTCRDVKPFVRSGWRISALRLFDLFPQTWHVETVFTLDRG